MAKRKILISFQYQQKFQLNCNIATTSKMCGNNSKKSIFLFISLNDNHSSNNGNNSNTIKIYFAFRQPPV